MASLNFDASQVSPKDEPIPAGDYVAQIRDSEIKDTKAGTGQVLRLTWVILDGPFVGRTVFDRINVQNQNPTAEKIGQQTLSSICHTLGVLRLQDSIQLHNIPCKIGVKIKKDDQYGDSNEIKGYSAIGQRPSFAAPQQHAFAQPQPPAFTAQPQQFAPQQPMQQPMQQPAYQQPAGSAPPWAR
jgi:hypothetical protein